MAESRETHDGGSDVRIPERLRQIAKERGWSEDLVRRVAEARVPISHLDHWGWHVDPEKVEAQVVWHERLTTGDLRGREATGGDNEAFSELWSDAPEETGEWEIITERGPDAFAQFKLQENVTLSVLARGHELVACCSWSRRNVQVQGRRLSVTYGQALRVRRAYRRMGYGDQVRRIPWGIGCARPSVQYDLMRNENFAVVNWWTKYAPDFFEHTPKQEGKVPGIPVGVLRLPATPLGDGDRGFRSVRADDLPRCVELINRTHAGLDLFRPYSEEFLEKVLDEGFWGERPPFWVPVYAWPDYFVLEEGGRIRACAGLWDRGRNVRERWRRRGHEEERLMTDAAVLDFGFEEGAEEAMERLLRHVIERTHELGREHLVVPLDHLPDVARRMESYSPVLETRALRWGLRDPQVVHPYTDLRYW